jgi:CheY-like chemotaxis protein/HPt (histidine-containing phosphotransfer) domain-containing protein
VDIEVNDSGIGIEREALARVFNAFEQAERSVARQFGGLGLGLSISKAIVEMHGGEIAASSEGRNKGATFRIRLPMTAPVKQPEVSMAVEQIIGPLRILLVEDHGATAEMIRMVLSEKGHTVEIAGDVSTALELADRHKFDILVSDLGLPDGSGHDLMRELRMRGHEFPAIALSGYGQEDDIRRSHLTGFASHLIKPATREAVLNAVAAAAAGKGQSKLDLSTAHQAEDCLFDRDLALKRCYGNPEMLEGMLESFRTDSIEQLGLIHAAVGKGELAEVGRAAHRLRGTVSYLGAQPAADAAQQAEQAAKSGNLSATEKAIIELERQIELLKKSSGFSGAKPRSF